MATYRRKHPVAVGEMSLDEQRRHLQAHLAAQGLEVGPPPESVTDAVLDQINSGETNTILYLCEKTEEPAVWTPQRRVTEQ